MKNRIPRTEVVTFTTMVGRRVVATVGIRIIDRIGTEFIEAETIRERVEAAHGPCYITWRPA